VAQRWPALLLGAAEAKAPDEAGIDTTRMALARARAS
jgi:hypothetical protein